MTQTTISPEISALAAQALAAEQPLAGDQFSRDQVMRIQGYFAQSIIEQVLAQCREAQEEARAGKARLDLRDWDGKLAASAAFTQVQRLRARIMERLGLEDLQRTPTRG
jgi:hypothetical protein